MRLRDEIYLTFENPTLKDKAESSINYEGQSVDIRGQVNEVKVQRLLMMIK